MDLFDFNNNEETAKPLAERMRANSSVFFATQNLPSPNDYRGRLNYFGW